MRVGAATKRFACNLTLSQYNEQFLLIIIFQMVSQNRDQAALTEVSVLEMKQKII